MTLTQNLDVSTIIAIITIITAIVTAFGVWVVPFLLEYWRRYIEIKKIVKQLILDLESLPRKAEYYSAKKQEINRYLMNIEKNVIGPLKTELKSTLKSTENEAFRKAIEEILYVLGDKEVMTRVFVRSKNTLINSWYLDDALRNTLDDIIYFEIVELAPLLFERLQQEKDNDAVYIIIKALGTLEYRPALPYILQLANKHLERPKDINFSRTYIMAIGNIALKNLNALTAEEFNQVTGVFTTVLNYKDSWSMDGLIDDVVRVKLPIVLERKGELHDSLIKNLIESLSGLLNHNQGNIRMNALMRLVQLNDKRAVFYLKKLLQMYPNHIDKPYLERAVQLLEGVQ